MKVAFGSDHAGWPRRTPILAELRAAGVDIVDCGSAEMVPGDDYPDVSAAVGRAVANGEAERGVLKDRADLDAVLLLAGLALPDAPGADVGVVKAAALWANRARRPPKLGHKLGGDFDIREVADGLKKRGRKLRTCAHKVSLLPHER